MHKVLFVCTGNICRSPTAQGVLLQKVRERGVAHAFHIASAGLIDHHVGEAPDPRTLMLARARGYDLSTQRARHFKPEDFAEFDHVFAMDEGHLAQLMRLAPAKHQAKVQLWLTYSSRWRNQSVPDPYYGKAADFELVLTMVEEACEGFLRQLNLEKITI